MTVRIDDEFRSMIPPLRPEERNQLRANLEAEGCRDPLVVWKSGGILLDGHNRHAICGELGIPFEIVEVELPDREAAADWIDANQLGRRNLTPDQYSLLRGRRYNRAKRLERGGGDRRSVASDQNHQNDGNGPTAEKIAKQYGVSKATVERDGQFAEAVETIKAVDPQIEAKVTTGQAPPKGLIVAAAREIKRAEAEVKAEAAVPLIASRKDREAAAVWEKAKDKAEAILTGQLGTIAQAKREVMRAERRAELEAKAKAAEEDNAAAEVMLSWSIIEGNCLDVLAGMGDGSVRLAFADPPYNIGIDYGDHYDDNRPPDEFRAWCRSWMAEVHRTLADDGSLWLLVNHEWGWALCADAVESVGFHLRQWLTWYESFGVNCTGKFNRCSRPLLWLTKSRDRFVFHDHDPEIRRESDRQRIYNDKRADPGGKLWDDVWGITPPIPRLVDNNRERIPDFPTQLPLSLLRPIVACASDPGDIVLDPFNGSGTTGAACIELGRGYIGVELSPEFARVATLRLKAQGSQSRETG